MHLHDTHICGMSFQHLRTQLTGICIPCQGKHHHGGQQGTKSLFRASEPFNQDEGWSPSLAFPELPFQVRPAKAAVAGYFIMPL